MIHRLHDCVLRMPEPRDAGPLYDYKNDPAISELLLGFHTGMALSDILEWIEYHRKRKDEVLWVIVDPQDERCLGHVGLYQIDHRIRSAEFAIMIGDRSSWGRGLGRSVSAYVVGWGFRELNLNRIQLSVLASNERAMRLYRSLGFVEEGRQRQAQFKNDQYLDVLLMSILRSEWTVEGEFRSS